MNTETVKVHEKGEGFEIIVQHDQTGSAYGIDLSKEAYEQLRLHFVSDSLNMDECKHIFYYGVTKGNKVLQGAGRLDLVFHLAFDMLKSKNVFDVERIESLFWERIKLLTNYR